ncbi:hypothetical protein [Planktothrix sp.]|uniref:hypothetical protein n=1 Tax=Planktothrix sp. TaxID=3088171 RepID=UPI0038D4AD1D
MVGKKYKCDSLSEDIQAELIALYQQGYSFRYLEKWLDDRGFKILQKQIQNWLTFKLEGVKKSDLEQEKSIEYQDKIDRDTTANPIIDDPIELEKIAKNYNIPDNIQVMDTSPEDVIGASQKMISDLFLSTGVLVKNRLNLYEQGQAKFPIEQVKALKLLYEMFSPLLGIPEYISPISAIKSLEYNGYDVSKLTQNTQNVATQNNTQISQ